MAHPEDRDEDEVVVAWMATPVHEETKVKTETMTRSLQVSDGSGNDSQEWFKLIWLARAAFRHVDIVNDALANDWMLAQVSPFQRCFRVRVTSLEVALMLIALPGMDQVE